VVNFDLGEQFPRPGSQQWGSLHPRARRVAVLGVGTGWCPLPIRGSGGITPGIFFVIFDAKSAFGGNLGEKINSSRVNLTSTT